MGWEPGLAGSCSQRLWGRRLPLQGRREKSLCLEPGKVSRLLMPCAPWATTPQSLGTHGQTDRRIFSSPSLAPLTSSSFSPRIPSGQHPPDTSSPQIIPLLSLPGSRQNTLSRIAKILQTPNFCRVETMTPSFHKIKEPRSPAPASLRPKVTGSKPLLSQRANPSALSSSSTGGGARNPLVTQTLHLTWRPSSPRSWIAGL